MRKRDSAARRVGPRDRRRKAVVLRLEELEQRLVPSGYTKTFRTDSGPDLDFYQPCNGGDNVISFPIQVSGIDVGQVRSARLTLSVWDVDYNGFGLGGNPERDTVALNGHSLTKPTAYLTGADNQWSTCTFDVDPTWVVSGSNNVRIAIDILNGGWCVSCDWAELSLEMQDIRIDQLSALDDTNLSQGGSPLTPDDVVWNIGGVSQPIADGAQVNYSPSTLPGKFNLKARVGADSGSLPNDDFKVKYEWSISGTGQKGNGEFTANASHPEGQITVTMPNAVGKYSLDTKFEIYDKDGNRINQQSMSETLYATLYSSLFTEPEVIWVDKATTWAAGATTPEGALTSLNSSLYNQHWLYRDALAGTTWQELVEGTGTGGNCYTFSNTWQAVGQVLGINTLVQRTYGANNKGFITKTGAVSPDGITGNAHQPNGPTDRWRFSMHQVGSYGGRWYDPTFNNTWTGPITSFIQWDITGTARDSTGRAADQAGGYRFYFRGMGPYEWGDYVYMPALSVNDVSTAEGNSGSTPLSFTVSLSAPSTNEITVDFATSDGTAVAPADYTAASGMLKFAPGELTKTVAVSVIGDTVPEAGETFYLNLSGATNAVIDFSRGKGKGTILNDDVTPHGLSPNVADAAPPFVVSPGGGVLVLNPGSSRGVDTDGDGIFNMLALDVQLDGLLAGDYTLIGYLEQSGQFITDRSNVNASLPFYALVHVDAPGPVTATVLFSGEDIYRSGLDSPYTAHLLITDGVATTDEKDLEVTGFTHAQFGELQAHFAGAADFGRDANGNGLFDDLVVGVMVDARVAASGLLQGALYASSGELIASASVPVALAVPGGTVELAFDGTSILRSGFDGPYVFETTLFDAALNPVDFSSGTTNAYSHLDFESRGQLGSYHDHGEDTNGNGKFDLLVIDAQVEVETSGVYTIEASLYDTRGTVIAATTASAALSRGTGTFRLEFSGAAISQNGVDGPYFVRYVALRDSGYLDAVQDAFTTAAYSYTQFEAPSVGAVALTGVYSDVAVDTSGNGLFDALRVNVQVVVKNAGTYNLNARLMDKLGNEITWASTSASFTAGQQRTLQLSFDGRQIGNRGMNGPFILQDVYVYNTANLTLSDTAYRPYQTAAYLASQFEGYVARNTAPVLDPIADVSTSEGSLVSFVVTATDPDAGQTLTYSLASGAPLGAAINPATGRFTWSPANGPTAVNVTVQVIDNGTPVLGDVRTFRITVGNAAPVVSAGADQTVAPGTAVSLGALTFTDPGTLDTHTAVINWGDGTVEPGAVTEAGGSGSVAGSHAFSAPGTYTVVVTVTDNDKAAASGHFKVTIAVPLAVAQTTVNGGAAQRSNIEKLSVRFNQETNLQALIDDGSIVSAVMLFGTSQVMLTPANFTYDSATFTLTIRRYRE